MITIAQTQAIYKLYPQVKSTVDDIAYDADGNQVFYDLEKITVQAETDAQNAIAAKASALAKLTALGLTQAEVTALIG